MHERWDGWEEYYCRGWGLDPDVTRDRLDFLKREQERAMFNYYEDDEPFFYTDTRHDLDFSCQCASCVRMHTINMADRDFLVSIGVMWKPAPVSHET